MLVDLGFSSTILLYLESSEYQGQVYMQCFYLDVYLSHGGFVVQFFTFCISQLKKIDSQRFNIIFLLISYLYISHFITFCDLLILSLTDKIHCAISPWTRILLQ